MSGAHEEDNFEDAIDDVKNQAIQPPQGNEETVDVSSSASSKNKKKNKKKKNKSKSSSQVDLVEDSNSAEAEVIENVEDPQIPSDAKEAFGAGQEPVEAKQTEDVDTAADAASVKKESEIIEGESSGGIEVEADADADAEVEDKEAPESSEDQFNSKVSDNSLEPPLSESTDHYPDDTKELEEENKKLEDKLEELKLLDSSDAESNAPDHSTESSAKEPPVLPDRSIVAKPPPPALPTRESQPATPERFPFPIPPLPPKVTGLGITTPASAVVSSHSSGPPLPGRDLKVGSPLSPGAHSFVSKSPEDFLPPPLPPQLTPAQKSHHRSGVLSSWFGRSSTPDKSDASISEKSVEYEENYDLLLSRLSENNDDYQSKDEAFKEQYNTSQNTLKSSFKDKLSHLEEEESSNVEETNDDSELNKIDWPFWTQVVNDYSSVAKSDPSKISKEISRGIPKQIRGIIWQLVAKSNPQEFEERFEKLVNEETPFEKSIQKDLSRTSFISGNGIDRESLYRVIKVYSLLDPEVGYTQGMAFITVPLLLNLSEVEALSLLHKLMNGYHVRSLYLPEMPGLMLALYEFDRLVEDLLPNVHTHFQRQGVRSSMYASQWFLTFFAYKFPLEFVLRIFDIVITEGFEALLKFAIALIQKNEELLLSFKFDELLEFLKGGLFNAYLIEQIPAAEEEDAVESTNFTDLFRSKRTPAAVPITVDSYDVDQLVEDATNVKIAPITLKRYQDEYQEIYRQEKERREEVDELRVKNTQLRKEIKKVESSYTILNREHVQIANEMINGRMKIATLEDENKDLREQNAKLRERIKVLQTPEETPVPSSLEEDLKLTMERNLEVMTKNQELEDQVSQLLHELEELKAKEIEATEEQHTAGSKSPKKHHTPSTSAWTKKFFKA